MIISLHYLEDILVPILYGIFLAMVFLPLAAFLESKKVPRVASIFICLFLMIISIGLISFLLYSELGKLSKDLPLFQKKVMDIASQLQLMAERITKVSVHDQTVWIEGHYSKALSEGSNVVKSLLVAISQSLEIFLFVIIYFFFFLLLRDRFQLFTFKLIEKEHHTGLESVLKNIQGIVQKYMVGQLKVMAIIGALNAIGFMIIGVKQAIFWGFLRGLLIIIPYLGPVLGAIFPALSSLTYEESIWAPIAVIGVVAITQVIQDNFLVPKIIGSNLKLNPLVTIMAILIGGKLWGVNGMILFLPIIAILKIVFDNVESLKPYSYLLGDD